MKEKIVSVTTSHDAAKMHSTQESTDSHEPPVSRQEEKAELHSLWFLYGGMVTGVVFVIGLQMPHEGGNEEIAPIVSGLIFAAVGAGASMLTFGESRQHGLLTALWFSFVLAAGIIIPFLPWQLFSLCF